MTDPPAPPLLSPALLEQLEQRWHAKQAPIASRLRPGLSDGEMDALTARLGLRLPDEARMWWAWHDGAEPTGFVYERSIGGLSLAFLSLEESVEETRRQRAVPAHDAVASREKWWWPSWLALTPSNGSIVCDCAVGPGQPTPIRFVWWGSTAAENAEVKARSLGELATWWIEAFDVGAWTYHPESVGWDPRPERLRPELRSKGLI
jgi:cell wall assembly regulator SMI1